ncbi:2-oxoglutarate oxidoreductase subunit KorB [Pelotomaculum schinkii]|uniref:2-oxoglutarate oxidoreductase subunit KorB n=1 Tax=Pelotomaculum schinkii TaxID=78350 RepID=A0A4Y7R6S8_9FIRM|nr:thiamine pyrophosphate-dependent enzyme [Pelotomaculum schinkii]TEB04463.1 2-oxoglutarate oxidoreductase subunit KorB [Pelotomaculum schinkii]
MSEQNASWKEYIKESMLPQMWCSGCGNGIVLGALARAMAKLNLEKNKVVVVTGIGCWGKADDYFTCSALHGTHGRALAFATGVKAANPELDVIVLMGDGDGVTIGGNHLIHAARRNIDLTVVLLNNNNYGMTGGQASALTPLGMVTSTTKYGNPERDLDICSLVDAAGANYVARGTVYHVPQLDKLISDGINKKGFSFIEALSPCPTHFGRRNKLGDAVKMVKTLKENAVNVNSSQAQEGDLKEGSFLIGKLAERYDDDFNTAYEKIRQKIKTK